MVALLTLIACGPAQESDSDTGIRDACQSEWGCGSYTDLTVDWDPVETGGEVTITLVDSDATGATLGIAETASGEAGWYGEDCLVDERCHHLAPSSELTYVDTVEDVILGQTTLFDGGSDGLGDAFLPSGGDRLTYVFRIEGGEYDGRCFVWGDDIAYYAELACDPW